MEFVVNLTIRGSQLSANNNIQLSADNQVSLLAGENTASSKSTSKSSSASLGVSFNLATGAIDVNLSASRSRGKSDGSDLGYTNTQAIASNNLSITSGGSTSLIGAAVAGKSVNIDVGKQFGGNLTIESLQDTSIFVEKTRSSGFTASAGMSGVGGSVSKGKSDINSNFQSVGQQSSIQAGDKGFNVNVTGNTTLTGGAITSTQAAVDNKLNSFNTGTKNADGSMQAGTGNLTITNINNAAAYTATSSSVTVGAGTQKGSSKAGYGNESGNASSITVAGITGLAGDKTVLTGKDTSNALAPIFNKDAVKADIGAQVQITAQFGSNAANAWGTYSDQKEATAKTNAQRAASATNGLFEGKTAQEWKEAAACSAEGGLCRAAGQILIGGLTSGTLGGAAGAGAASLGAPLLNTLQDNLSSGLQTLGVSKDIAIGIAGVASGGIAMGVGNAIGGTGGAATAGNTDFNNRQLHPTERQRIAQIAKQQAQENCRGSAACETAATLYWTDMLERAAEGRVDSRSATQNNNYYQQIINASGTPGTEASSSGAGVAFFNDLGRAQVLLNTDAGKPILDSRGNPMLGTDGKPQTYFQATDGQRADAYGNIFPGGTPDNQSSIIPGMNNRDQDRLTRLLTPNGSTQSDTTIEELLIGVRLPVRTGGSLVVTTSTRDAVTLSAEQALLRSGGMLDRTGAPLLDMRSLTSAQKERVGDLFGADTVKQIVPDGVKIARAQGTGTQGIDDLFKVNRADVDYVNIEYKFVGQDGRTGSQVLGNTADGRQGSISWISGSNRLQRAVGDEAAVSVENSIKSGRFESWVVTTRPDGSTFVQVLDASGRPKPIDTSRLILPSRNLSGAQR